MNLAIASGKGGTGKTLVATNLAWVASRSSKVVLYDLDVEEPNCHLFLEPDSREVRSVEMMIPVVDERTCSHCGTCSEVCEFHAIVTLPDQVLVFPEMCHGCFGCLELCPDGGGAGGQAVWCGAQQGGGRESRTRGLLPGERDRDSPAHPVAQGYRTRLRARPARRGDDPRRSRVVRDAAGEASVDGASIQEAYLRYQAGELKE